MNGSLLSTLMDSDLDIDFVDASTYSEDELHKLQTEILRQSKEVEDYIRNEPNDNQSQRLKALKYLFTLFKTELSVNIGIRKALVEERNLNDKINKRINDFLNDMRNITEKNPENLKQVLTVVHYLQKKKNKYRNLKKNSGSIIIENKELRRENEQYRINVAELEMELAHSTAQLDSNKRYMAQYTKYSRQNDTLTYELNALQIEKQNLLQQIQIEANNLKNTEVKLADAVKKNSAYESQIARLTQELESIRSQFLDAESKRGELEAMLLKYDSRPLSNQLSDISLMEKINKQNKIIKQQRKTIDGYLNNLISDNAKIDQKDASSTKSSRLVEEKEMLIENRDEIIRDLTSKINDYHKELQHSIKKINDLRDISNQYKEEIMSKDRKISKLEAKLDVLKHQSESDITHSRSVYSKKLDQLNQTYENKMKLMKEEFERTLELLKSESKTNEVNVRETAEENYRYTIDQHELTERELRFKIEELIAENKVLKDQVKKLSCSLEKEEAELARLHTEKGSFKSIKRRKSFEDSPRKFVPLNKRFGRNMNRCDSGTNSESTYSDNYY